jgi:hypothetical protein
MVTNSISGWFQGLSCWWHVCMSLLHWTSMPQLHHILSCLYAVYWSSTIAEVCDINCPAIVGISKLMRIICQFWINNTSPINTLPKTTFFFVLKNKDINENYLEHFIPIQIYMFIPNIRFWSITSIDAKLMKFSINIKCTTLRSSCRKIWSFFFNLSLLHHTFKSTCTIWPYW